MFLNVLVIAVFFSSINVFSQEYFHVSNKITFQEYNNVQKIEAGTNFLVKNNMIIDEKAFSALPSDLKPNYIEIDVYFEEMLDNSTVSRQEKGYILKSNLIDANRLFTDARFKYIIAKKDASVWSETTKSNVTVLTSEQAKNFCKEYSELESEQGKKPADKGMWVAPSCTDYERIYNIKKTHVLSNFASTFSNSYYWCKDGNSFKFGDFEDEPFIYSAHLRCIMLFFVGKFAKI